MSCPRTNDQAERWLAQARNGDSDAFGQLLLYCARQVRHRLQGRHRHMIGFKLQAKFDFYDVAQQTCLKAQQYFPHFRGNTASEMTKWFLQIFRSTLDDMRRFYLKQRRRYTQENGPCEVTVREKAVAAVRQPLEELLDAEDIQRGNLAVLMLPPNYHLVLYFRVAKDMSYQEIADSMRSSEEAARQLYHRALDKLCETLAQPKAITEFGRQLEMQRKRRCSYATICKFADQYARQMKV
jgi:RNA polymerase sigma-70 factor, ECF subfamily